MKYMSSFLYDAKNKSIVINLKVQTKAHNNVIERPAIIIDGKYYFKVKINAVRENGKANKALIDFISDFLDVAKKNCSIVSGAMNHYKTIMLCEIDEQHMQKIAIKLQTI